MRSTGPRPRSWTVTRGKAGVNTRDNVAGPEGAARLRENGTAEAHVTSGCDARARGFMIAKAFAPEPGVQPFAIMERPAEGVMPPSAASGGTGTGRGTGDEEGPCGEFPGRADCPRADGLFSGAS